MTPQTLAAPVIDPCAASRTARLDQLRALLADRKWSAQVVRLAADERAETVIEGYGTDGISQWA